MSKKFPAILFLAAMLFLPFISTAQAKDSSFESQAVAGKSAPNFTLTDTHGKKHNLADYDGKYIVLEWFNQQCPFVKKHYESGNMQNLQKEYTKKGVIWLSICSSAEGKPGYFSAEEHNKMFAKEKAAPTAILLDSDGKVGHLYGAKSTPDMFVINPKGILIYAGAIDDKPDLEDSVSTAKNYVKAALEESMAGKPVAVASTKSYGCSVKYE
jgi:peroxiredoxin